MSITATTKAEASPPVEASVSADHNSSDSQHTDRRPSSSTERSRTFRARQRKLGSKPSGIVLSARAQLAIEVIKTVRGQGYKVRIIENALIQEARRLCPCDERLAQLIEKGALPPDVASAWGETLSQVEREEEQAANRSTDEGPVKKERSKGPRDLRVRIGNRSGVRIDGSTD